MGIPDLTMFCLAVVPNNGLPSEVGPPLMDPIFSSLLKNIASEIFFPTLHCVFFLLLLSDTYHQDNLL